MEVREEEKLMEIEIEMEEDQLNHTMLNNG